MSSSSKAGQLTPIWILIQKNKITTFYYAKDGSMSPTQLWAKIGRRQGDWTGFQIWTPWFHRLQQGLKMEQAGGESNGTSIQALRTLSRLWRFLPFNLRDRGRNCSGPSYLHKQLQRVQNTSASFVRGRYLTEVDVIGMKWLPVLERFEFSMTKLAWKSINCCDWPKYLPMRKLIAKKT